MSSVPTAVDLFSGAGGASLGIVGAGYDLRLAADISPACGMTHTANLPGDFLVADLREVDAEKILTTADVTAGNLDLLFAGPPCQGFSIIGARVVWDERNNLYREVLRIAGDMQPRCIVIENVPGLVNLARGGYLEAILEGLHKIGYHAACAELLAAQYGAPQMRWRLVIIAWRLDLGIPAGYGFPQPTVGTAGALRDEAMAALRQDDPCRVFVYFQDKLGGEIGLSATTASPELSFDITVVELLAPDRTQEGPAYPLTPQVKIGRYGVIELQTSDTHDSYKQAVTALTNALDLHRNHFPQMLADNPEWAGRKVEGPNISNVFKRTFYQIAFKFQVTKRDTSAGCVLALPQPVWDSWQPFLGAPGLREQPDGTWRLLDDHESSPSNWIYVFDIDETPSPAGPALLHVRLIIGTDAQTLSKAAFDIAPAMAVEHGGGTDAVVSAIVRRLGPYIPGIGLLT